jgi:Uma2 family endonuclease
MSALPKRRYSLEEYLELDKNSEERYEYFDGEVVAMAGAKLSHNRVARNMIRSLENKLDGTDCEVLPADMRIKVPTALPYRYPDLVVVCGEPMIEDLQGQEMLLNPLLIVEVLSESTEAYDQGRKFTAYQSIPSFREYLLVAQDRPHVIQYVRQASGKWLRTDIEGLDETLTLETINCTLTLAEIYRRVKFPSEDSA